MPTKIRIIHACDFLQVTSEGDLDFEASKKLLMKIGAAISPQDDYHILVDTRKAHSVLLPGHLWELARIISTCGETFRIKTAMLCPDERFERAQFFELCAHNRGYQVHAFTAYEQAIEWLCDSTEIS